MKLPFYNRSVRSGWGDLYLVKYSSGDGSIFDIHIEPRKYMSTYCSKQQKRWFDTTIEKSPDQSVKETTMYSSGSRFEIHVQY